MTSPVGDETKRQVVILLFGAVGTIVTVGLVYKFSNPDAMKTLKMRAALWAKRTAQSQADKWQEYADMAATMYNREKP